MVDEDVIDGIEDVVADELAVVIEDGSDVVEVSRLDAGAGGEVLTRVPRAVCGDVDVELEVAIGFFIIDVVSAHDEVEHSVLGRVGEHEVLPGDGVEAGATLLLVDEQVVTRAELAALEVLEAELDGVATEVFKSLEDEGVVLGGECACDGQSSDVEGVKAAVLNEGQRACGDAAAILGGGEQREGVARGVDGAAVVEQLDGAITCDREARVLLECEVDGVIALGEEAGDRDAGVFRNRKRTITRDDANIGFVAKDQGGVVADAHGDLAVDSCEGHLAHAHFTARGGACVGDGKAAFPTDFSYLGAVLDGDEIISLGCACDGECVEHECAKGARCLSGQTGGCDVAPLGGGSIDDDVPVIRDEAAFIFKAFECSVGVQREFAALLDGQVARISAEGENLHFRVLDDRDATHATQRADGRDAAYARRSIAVRIGSQGELGHRELGKAAATDSTQFIADDITALVRDIVDCDIILILPINRAQTRQVINSEVFGEYFFFFFD